MSDSGSRWDQPHSDAYTAADFHAPPGEVSRFTEDAVATRFMSKVAQYGDGSLYREVMDGLDPAVRAEVEAAEDRYSREMRARGTEPGW